MKASKIWHYVVIGFAVLGAAVPVIAGEPKLAAVAAGLLAAERLFQAVRPVVDQEIKVVVSEDKTQ